MAAATLEDALKQQCFDPFFLVFVNKSVLSSITCKDLESNIFIIFSSCVQCKFMPVPWGLSVFVMEIHVVHNNMQFNFATDCKILCLLLNLCSDVLIWIKGLKFVRCFNLDAFVLMFKSFLIFYLWKPVWCSIWIMSLHFYFQEFESFADSVSFLDFMFFCLDCKFSLHILAIYIFMRCNPLHFTYLLPET